MESNPALVQAAINSERESQTKFKKSQVVCFKEVFGKMRPEDVIEQDMICNDDQSSNSSGSS